MSKVMQNGNGRVKFPINEPAEGRRKSQIEDEVGIEEFTRLCRESVKRYVDDWERLTDRIGDQGRNVGRIAMGLSLVEAQLQVQLVEFPVFLSP